MIPSSNTLNQEKGVDPVCGMDVPQTGGTIVVEYEGCRYYFCAEACREAFQEDPQKYLEQKPKGIWGRYLERLTKATGGKSFKCH